MTNQTEEIQNNENKGENTFPILEDSFLSDKIIVHRWKLLEQVFELTNLCNLARSRKVINNDDKKKLERLIEDLEAVYNELGELVPVEVPLVSGTKPVFDHRIIEFYPSGSKHNMWRIAIQAETILCEINRYKKSDQSLKKLNVKPILAFFEQEVGDAIADEDELPVFRVYPFKDPPFDDEKISNRWDILNRIFGLECFCGWILNCPTISQQESDILTNLNNELYLLQRNLGKLIPSTRPLMAGGKPSHIANTRIFYYDNSKENLQSVSQEASEIIRMIDDSKKDDSLLGSLDVKRVQSANFHFISDKKE